MTAGRYQVDELRPQLDPVKALDEAQEIARATKTVAEYGPVDWVEIGRMIDLVSDFTCVGETDPRKTCVRPANDTLQTAHVIVEQIGQALNAAFAMNNGVVLPEMVDDVIVLCDLVLGWKSGNVKQRP